MSNVHSQPVTAPLLTAVVDEVWFGGGDAFAAQALQHRRVVGDPEQPVLGSGQVGELRRGLGEVQLPHGAEPQRWQLLAGGRPPLHENAVPRARPGQTAPG